MISRDPLREPVRPVRLPRGRRRQRRRGRRLANFRDDGFGFLRAAAVMDEHLGACLGEVNALARPMPREAPVTRAVFPESVVMT